jgi:hypothetical protein
VRVGDGGPVYYWFNHTSHSHFTNLWGAYTALFAPLKGAGTYNDQPCMLQSPR